MTSKPKPWQKVPTEIMTLAIEHFRGEREADQRVAFLLLDVGVETLFKTFLMLDEKTTGTKLAFGERKKAIEGNFHELCQGMERGASMHLQDDDLAQVQWFHMKRNLLYHEGIGVAIPKSDVGEYAALAIELLNRLLDVDLTNELVKARVVNKRAADEVASKRRTYQEFFAELLRRFKAERPRATQATKTQPMTWFAFGAGKQNVHFGWSFGKGDVLRVEITFISTDEEVNKAAFDKLHSEKVEIEREIGMGLDWDRMDGHIHSRIRTAYPFQITDDARKLELAKQWAVNTMVKFYDVFQPRIKEM